MSVITQRKTHPRVCIILILSVLCFVSTTSYAFQNNASKKKEKYEFTDTRISEADSLLKNRQYAQALEAYEKAYAIYESENFYEGMVYAKERMGYSLLRSRKYSSSFTLLYEAINLFKAHNLHSQINLSRAYYNASRAIYAQRNFEAASRYIDSAMWVYDQSEYYDSALLRPIVDYKYYTYHYSNQSGDTLIKYLNERGRLNELRQVEVSTNVFLLIDYSAAYNQIGDFEKSTAYAVEAVRLCEENLENLQEEIYAEVLFNLGRTFNSQREYARAIKIAEKLVNYVEEYEPDNGNYLAYLNLKAVILNSLERYSEAAEIFGIILEKMDRLGMEELRFYRNTLTNYGVSYQFMAEYDLAEKYHKLALEKERNSNERGLTEVFIPRYRYLGQLYAAQGQFEQAFSYYDSALRSSLSNYDLDPLEFPDGSEIEVTFALLGIITEKQSNLSELVSFGGFDKLELAKVIMDHTQKAHHLILNSRDKLQASQGRLFLSESYKDLYEVGINAAYFSFHSEPENKSHLADAVDFFSFSKSILFMEQSGELGKVQDERLPPILRDEYYAVKTKIDRLETQFYQLIDSVATSDSLRSVNSELLALNGKMKGIQEKIEEYLGSEGAKISLGSNALDHVKSYLARNKQSGVIEYFVGENDIYILALSENNSAFFKVPYNERLKKSLEFVVQAVSTKPSIDDYADNLTRYQAEAVYLFNQLMLEPLSAIKSSDLHKLKIIPDQELSQIPFESLVSKSKEGISSYKEPHCIKIYFSLLCKFLFVRAI